MFFFENLIKRNHELKYSNSHKFESGLQEVFEKVRNIITHDYLVFIVSDFHRYSQNVIKEISYMAAHNDVILAKVYDPLERNLLPVKYVGGDGVKQLSIDGKDEKLVKDFQEGFDADYMNFEKEMKKHKIPMFKINTVDDVSEQIQNIFNGI